VSETERDISFETLAQACAIDISQLTKSGRGELNGALKQLRDALPDFSDLELSLVIEDRAKAYRQTMPDVMLTPSALVKHWAALEGVRARQETYPEHEPLDCPTCGDLRMVEREDGWGPCPTCNGKALAIVDRYHDRQDRAARRSPLLP